VLAYVDVTRLDNCALSSHV